MNNKEKLRRTVIEAIHGLKYEYARRKEKNGMIVINGGHPITIGRVMQALKNKNFQNFGILIRDGSIYKQNYSKPLED